MQKPKKDGAVTRKNSTHITVYCLPSEKEAIEEKARAARLSVAGYLRMVGLGYEVQSVMDAELVLSLAKVNADQGRLGGLLKLWLTDDARFAAFDEARMRATIQAVLERIGETQEALRKLAEQA